jgi:hypothetical protein
MTAANISVGIVTTHNIAPRRIAPKTLKSMQSLRWTDEQSPTNPSYLPSQRIYNIQQHKPLPDPKVVAENLARALIEVRIGVRRLAGLQRFLKPNLYGFLQNQCGNPTHTGAIPGCVQVRSNRILHVAPAIVEATVLVEVADRIRAVALRIEAIRGRWVVTALDMP